MAKRVIENFIYPEITEGHYTFGQQITNAPILRPDGDWRPYLPPEELQRRNGVESSACFIEAQQHAIATILEEEFDIPNQNFSARFNLMFSNATPSGGDPLKAAQSFRDKGLIPDTLLPFSDQITSWEQFNSFFGGDRTLCLSQGKAWRREWSPKYDIVVRREMDLDTKYTLLKQALKNSPICVSVYGVQDGDSYIPKPKGVSDTHLVELVYIDRDDYPYVFDTYSPFLKKLPKKYNFDFGMRHIVERVSDQQINILELILQKLQEWLNLIKTEQMTPVPTPTPIVPVEPPQPPTEPVKLILWGRAIEAFESAPKSWNNPGAIRGTNGKFLQFKNYETGWQYLLDYLRRAGTGKHKAYKPDYSLLKFFQVYAPASDNNNPLNYARFVAGRLGVDTSIAIKELVV